MKKSEMQEEEYVFPYHYLATLKVNTPFIYKRLSWGFEYLTYIEFIRSYIEEEINPRTMLDIGCGDGYLINVLSYSKDNEFIGVDLSEKAIKFAKAFSNGYEFECIDVFDLDQKFDLVTLIEVLEHIPDNRLDSFIKESFSKVKKGGYMIISVPTTVDIVHKKHYRHYDESLLKQQISLSDFRIVSQVRLYTKSKILERLIKFSQARDSKTIKRWIWAWHKKNTFYSNKIVGKHLVTIYHKVY